VPAIREPGEGELNEQAGMVPSRVLAVVPGAFKPPHRGHVAMVAEYAGEADEVIVLVSPVSREGVTADQSIAIWNIYLEELPYDNIKVMRSPVNSPVLRQRISLLRTQMIILYGLSLEMK
jgi:phosphopantetheine adenylyltransferase